MFDIKKAYQLEAIAELARNIDLPVCELAALKEMKKMKDDLTTRLDGAQIPEQYKGAFDGVVANGEIDPNE